MGYCFIVKTEFENTWPDILSEKIADLATVERVEQFPYTASYGTKTMTIGDSPNPAHDELMYISPANGKIACIKYDGGFFLFYGWLCDGVVLVRPIGNGTINKKMHKVVEERITEIFDEMKDRYWKPPTNSS